jgi:hypothetical protein
MSATVTDDCPSAARGLDGSPWLLSSDSHVVEPPDL